MTPDGYNDTIAGTDIPALTLSGVSFGYEGSRRVLDDVSLSVRRGELMLIEGPNGGGKTTLVRLLLGLLHPTKGSIRYFDAGGKPAARLRMGYLPQKTAVDSRFPITVRETVESALLAAPRRAWQKEAVNDALRRVGLEALADRYLGELSGGQVQRALLARAIVSEPELLILDEPLSYLDEQRRLTVLELVASMTGKVTIIIVTHEPQLFAPLGGRRVYVSGTLTEAPGL